MFTEKKDHNLIKIELRTLIKKNTYEIKYLKTYLSSSTESLMSRELELKEKMNSDVQDEPEDERILQSLYEKEISKVSSYFFHSSLVLIYSFFENALYNICTNIQSDIGANFSYKDLFGNNIIKKSKYYLELTTAINFEEANKNWDRITQFQKLRNYIIHQNSTIADKDQIKFNNMFPTIEIVDDNFFIKDHSLAFEFLDVISEFLNFIYGKVHSTSFLGKAIEKQAIDLDMPF